MNLKNKRILITAGPTWVPIDKVRVISNIASGRTGMLLAKLADRLGASVTLILGPVGEVDLDKSISIKRFFYFNELHNLVRSELKTKKYDIVIHSAAVSDYKPKKMFSRKIQSNIRNLNIELETTVKIADRIKKYAPDIFLAIFKLELNLPRDKMIERARKTMQESGADLTVVNTFSNKHPYKAMIIDRSKVFYKTDSKEELARKLLEIISFQSN